MHGTERVLLLHENTCCSHTADTFLYFISSQTYASMSLVTDAAYTEILCSRSEMSVASGNTNLIIPFTQLHKEVTQCYIWLPCGQKHPTTPFFNTMSSSLLWYCYSDILTPPDENEVVLHLPG